MIANHQPNIFPANVIAGVSSVEDGSMKFEWGDRDAIVINAARFLNKIGSSIDETANLFISGESGWDVIREVGESERGEGMREPSSRREADVLITNHARVGLFLPIADCYGVIIYDPKNVVLALAHMGWQSTEKESLRKTIDYLISHFDTSPVDLLIYVTPGIKQQSYRFKNLKQANDPKWKSYLKAYQDGSTGIDLLNYNLDVLKACGVVSQHIEVADVDTATDADYYSHYGSNNLNKTGTEGRFAVSAMIKT